MSAFVHQFGKMFVIWLTWRVGFDSRQEHSIAWYSNCK